MRDDDDDGPSTRDEAREPEHDEIKRLQEAAREQLEREREESERREGATSDDE